MVSEQKRGKKKSYFPTAKSKIMVFWLLWPCLKRYYSHFWHVDAISHCTDNSLVFLQRLFVTTHPQMVFLKKLKTAKCSPNLKRPKIGVWTHLIMLCHNPTGSFKFCNSSIGYGPFSSVQFILFLIILKVQNIDYKYTYTRILIY